MLNLYHSRPKGVVPVILLIIGIVAVLAVGTGIVIYTIQNKEGGLLNMVPTNKNISINNKNQDQRLSRNENQASTNQQPSTYENQPSPNTETKENKPEEWYFEPFSVWENETSHYKWGFRDTRTDKIVIEPKYDLTTPFHEGLAAVRINYKWGFIDKTGKWIIEPKYDDVGAFSGGVAAVEINNKSYCINTKGEIIKKVEYMEDCHP